MRSIVIGFALLAGGCLDPTTRSEVRWKASHEWRCDESGVTVRALRVGVFEATGCGRSQTYDCNVSECVPVSAPSDASPNPDAP